MWTSSKEGEREYSSSKKAYYAPIPFDSEAFNDAPADGSFDVTRLRQTDVLDLIHSLSSPHQTFGKVSLAQTISPLLNKMGTMQDFVTKEDLGTCTLIARNLVLVARHAIEGHDICRLKVTFGYTEFRGSCYIAGQAFFDCIIEEDTLCDYAIIRLKKLEGRDLGFVSLNAAICTVEESALLHYPLEKPLKVSVHAFVETQHQADYLIAYHDSDYLSSGGAYFDPKGRMVAMHLGAQQQQQEKAMNLTRYALPLEMIVRSNPHSLLNKFALGMLSQADSYAANQYETYLTPRRHKFLIDEEGRESEKILRGLLTSALKKDKGIKLTSRKTISFSPSNLNYIASKYRAKYDTFIEKCLGKTGLHGFTQLYSVKEGIESDHTIPHNVWKSTKNDRMKKIVKGGGKRQGERDMPAITIPWGIHRKLRTTGGVSGYKAFHKSLIDLCDNDHIDEALILCYEEYAKEGLSLDAYKNDIENSLDDHVKLKLISVAQKKKIIARVF